MGERTTVFENKSCVQMEFRVFLPPDRPDHFRKIIRLEPGEKKAVVVKPFHHRASGSYPMRPVMIMLFAESVYTGLSLQPFQLVNYRRVICDRRVDGFVHLRCIKASWIDYFKLRYYGYFIKMRCCGRANEEIGGEISTYFSISGHFTNLASPACVHQ